MQAEVNELYLRLSSVADEIRQFRERSPGRRIPDACKSELAKLTREGVSFAKIRKATGIQKVVLKPFLGLAKPDAHSPRPFRVINIREESERPSSVAEQVQVTFSYQGGKVTAQITASGLTTDILRVLTSC